MVVFIDTLIENYKTKYEIYLDKNYTARDLFNLLRARTFPGKPACTFKDNNETYEITVNIKRKVK